MTRRTAFRALAAGIAGTGRICSANEATLSTAPSRSSSNGPVRLEHQATGSEVWQVTWEEFDQHNIYCEVPYCSRDSRCFVYLRRNPKREGPNKEEIMAVELGTWKQNRLDAGIGIRGSAITHDGVFYYLKQTGGETLDLMRVDLSEGTPRKMHSLTGLGRIQTLGTVSADGRYYAVGKRLDDQYKMFGVVLTDLEKGTDAVIDRDPFIFNAHPQFEPGKGRHLMIQHNRGGTYSPDGRIQRSTGPEGATLYLLSVPDGRRIELQVGQPFTTPCTGHEAWIGKTKEILLTVAASGRYAPDKGNLLAVAASSSARVMARGYHFAHVGVSRCGRFFSCDDWRGDTKLVIGSTKTGRTAVVCESKASRGAAQNTHAHPYLTPDLKWVIFNSDRSGFPHIHAASVPEGVIEQLSEA